MKHRNLLLVVLLAAMAGLGGAALSCNLADAVTCDSDELDLEGGRVGDFGSDANALRIEAFFQATVDVQAKAHTLMTKMTTACRNIGLAIGLTEAQMQPTASDPTDAQRIEAACNPVAAEIRTIIRAAVPNGVSLSIAYTPPRCDLNVNAYANCAAGCEVDVTPGSLDVQCEPGTVQIGRCSASCSGECWLEASAECTGTCSATCTGTCSGKCYGRCAGTCEYPSDDPDNCAGACTGTCTGQCDATCTGSCSGSCRAEVAGGCTGECHGSCDDWGVTPPSCEVFARPPEVSAECHASCEASLSADLTCTRPELTVNYGQLGGDAAAQARLRALITALRANYGDVLIAAKETGTAVVEMVGALFGALDAFADSITTMLDAAACAIRALGVQVQVTATFSASASACGSLTGAVTVSGEATVGP